MHPGSIMKKFCFESVISLYGYILINENEKNYYSKLNFLKENLNEM